MMDAIIITIIVITIIIIAVVVVIIGENERASACDYKYIDRWTLAQYTSQ